MELILKLILKAPLYAPNHVDIGPHDWGLSVPRPLSLFGREQEVFLPLLNVICERNLIGISI